ncbi:CNNM domain-containing protein [Methanolobus mangrovi]|uniref:CNNM domain-containing protein n=1 Tax=Methanolobus mangrovi TaxID=3072977 RepID=A0AA51YK49_9EURY|nr:CNNM domain-containing protein [Methanolobus mangrovi]WMW23268.1 CNNM domain-containing protein [Methanolobus mangrovi]
MNNIITWFLIALCLLQSGIFSGLTIGMFGLTRLRLEIEAEAKNEDARKILEIRRNSHLLLSTLLWGNVGINVLLALLTDSIMSGASAFIFSTVLITSFGEIAPQAYFTRNSLRLGATFSPLVKLYMFLLYPVAKPSAIILDTWLGKEKMEFFKERSLGIMLRKHIISESSDIDHLEGLGALNFLTIDDLHVKQEGSVIDPLSIISLPTFNGLVIFPSSEDAEFDTLLENIASSSKKWVIVVDETNEPVMAIDSGSFLRDAVYRKKEFNPYKYCHHPIIVRDPEEKIGGVLHKLKVYPVDSEDDVIDNDLLLYWNKDDPEKIIITGSDILGRLLRGIVVRVE